MTEPLRKEEREEIWRRADGAVTRRGQPSDDWAWMACMLAEDTLRLLADLERVEAERDSLLRLILRDPDLFGSDAVAQATDTYQHVLQCKTDLALSNQHNYDKRREAEAERDRWYQTVQNEVRRASDDRQKLEARLARVVEILERIVEEERSLILRERPAGYVSQSLHYATKALAAAKGEPSGD